MPVARKTTGRTTTPKPKSGLRLRTFGSVADLREDAKSSGAMGEVWTVPKEGTCTVRFLTEPEGWIGFFEYFDSDANGYVPQADGDVIPKDSRSSFRYLANVLWQSDGQRQGKVTAFKMAKTVGISLANKYDKYGTLLDRDYEVTRYGEGLNTEYDVTPEERKKLALTKFELLDLEDVLVNERERVLGDGEVEGDVTDEVEPEDDELEEEDEDEAPAPVSRKGGVGRGGKRAAKPAPSKPSLADLGEAADDADDDAMGTLTALAEGVEQDPDDYGTWAELADAIDASMTALEIDTDEYDDWDAIVEELGEAVEDEDEESEEDEEEEVDEEVDEEMLNAKSLKELREFADEYGIDHSDIRTKAKLVAAILEEAEE